MLTTKTRLCFLLLAACLAPVVVAAASHIGREISVPRQEGVERAFTNGTADGDVVIEWNTAALNAIRAGRTPPPIASRALAILHASIYDAVNGIDRRHEAYFVQSAVPASASEEAAASTAAHKVLVTLFPANAASFDDLHSTILSAIRNGPQKSTGIAWGESVADRSEEHTSELQSPYDLVCRLLLEKKKK